MLYYVSWSCSIEIETAVAFSAKNFTWWISCHKRFSRGMIVLYCIISYCTVLYWIVLYSIMLYCTIQFSTVQYSMIWYNTVQYSHEKISWHTRLTTWNFWLKTPLLFLSHYLCCRKGPRRQYTSGDPKYLPQDVVPHCRIWPCACLDKQRQFSKFDFLVVIKS